MDPSSAALWSCMALALGAAACGQLTSPPQEPAPPELAPSEATTAVPPTPTIIAAHFARIDDPELGGRDGLLVVFDVQIDAASLQPGAFIVTRDDDGPARPERAILAPASEDDENRTVLLVGELGDAGHQPKHVAIIDSVFAEDGRPLRGLGGPVTPFDAPPQVVAAEVLTAASGRCEGVAQVLRTYWSDELRGVEPEDLARVRVQAGPAGTPAAPRRFDDHAIDHAEAGQDNVLDLCIDEPAPLERVWIDAGVFFDPAGHASAAVELRLLEPGA